MPLPILTFDALFKETVWGGRRLEALLEKKLPGSNPIGESWEVVDLPGDQSIVCGGPLAGMTLEELRKEHTAELLGEVPLLEGRFPLLFKFIDAQQTLSVQVHPDEAACARIGGGARPKTEAWYILDAEEGAVLYVGLREGVDRQTFAEGIETGELESLLHKVSVRPGDFVFLPSGTIHAIGKGIVLAEVQQSSDTTYRVFDWNRLGLDGNPRQLHVQEALQSIHFNTHGVPRYESPLSARPGIACSDFLMELVAFSGENRAVCAGEGPLVLMGIAGTGTVDVVAGDESVSLRRGSSVIVPAVRAESVVLEGHGQARVLATRMPVR